MKLLWINRLLLDILTLPRKGSLRLVVVSLSILLGEGLQRKATAELRGSKDYVVIDRGDLLLVIRVTTLCGLGIQLMLKCLDGVVYLVQSVL